MDGAQALLEAIPDAPVWVETRGMLFGGAAVVGAAEACVVVSKNGRLLSALGMPPWAVVEEALRMARPGAELLVLPDVVEHMARLLGRPGRPATIHSTDGKRLAQTAEPLSRTRLLAVSDDLTHVPAELRREIEEALGKVEVAAVMAGGRAVTFCYPGAITETLWDVSIDTLELHRRKGYATRAFLWMYRHLLAKRLMPVWGAFDDNKPSLRLARKLGFEPAGSLFVFEVSPLACRPGG